MDRSSPGVIPFAEGGAQKKKRKISKFNLLAPGYARWPLLRQALAWNSCLKAWDQ